MKEFNGVSSSHYIADEDMDFHGIAEAGLTIRRGVTVNLHGILQGPVIVEPDASLTVFGLIEGEIDDRGGKIVVHGLTDKDAGENITP
ncbi:hypothetical protein [Labrenzia sp. VG12]|uniref:hypothetical protein n=1 Tax=Labrenzia sp. VG12 TaxID=2021862 RepID=UPI000B8C6AF9|nr:hypothetical protein [Labrenzia sp. VG12]ASP33037.1 hypothetical protein CHH27_07065 [Labrenzia sp. VG12]